MDRCHMVRPFLRRVLIDKALNLFNGNIRLFCNIGGERITADFVKGNLRNEYLEQMFDFHEMILLLYVSFVRGYGCMSGYATTENSFPPWTTQFINTCRGSLCLACPSRDVL